MWDILQPVTLHDRVFRVLCIPPGDQLLTRLADVLTVEDGAGECAGDVQPVIQCIVGAVLDVKRAIQADVGRPGARPTPIHTGSRSLPGHWLL